MDHDALVDDVAEKAQMASRDDAERAAVETLRTFGEHISEGQAEDLAAVLPGDLGNAVTAHADSSPASFDPETFAARVAEREGSDVTDDDAMLHVRAVMAATAEHVGRDELQDAREQLPHEYATIFETDDLAMG